ncbi:MAG: hypothetical protein OEY59_13295 [Deltaproteobacteria bacterium]|nr:hypothetical protein [Deltaproteobacteria bacterium]
MRYREVEPDQGILYLGFRGLNGFLESICLNILKTEDDMDVVSFSKRLLIGS